MPTAGIICEFNPFHNGHAALFAKVRAALGADTAIVCAMSGNFVQRGEPAAFSKHARAEAALRCGADLVLELPLPWVLSSADCFALGGVSVLASLGIVDSLCFGSESGDLASLSLLGGALASPEAEDLIAAGAARGLSYAQARQKAAEQIAGGEAELLKKPNDLLAAEYLRALGALGSDIKPLCVLRAGSGHDSPSPDRENPSASFLRVLLSEGKPVSGYVPRAAEEIFMREIAEAGGPVTADSLSRAALSRLRALEPEDFDRFAPGGLGMRIARFARSEPDLASAAERAKTKRYPLARIRRVLLNAAIGADIKTSASLPPYIRVLGMSSRGMALLRAASKKASLPIITKPASVKKLDEEAQRVFALEAAGTDLWALGRKNPGMGGAEWAVGPVIIKD
ncbi:MAG: nucleotidyltransferase family protein [Oscillospiraceae bacterium]|nr:nucleotidyltransferase family protein [Oscillospiraceae bacterium]